MLYSTYIKVGAGAGFSFTGAAVAAHKNETGSVTLY
jgi:hypothetical protein